MPSTRKEPSARAPQPRPPAPTQSDIFLAVIGDSHASLFSGVDGLQPVFPERSADALPGVVTRRLGSRLAYSLTRPAHALRSELLAALASIPKHATVLFALGEIDCRCHVVPQALKTGRAIPAVGQDLAAKYVRAAANLVGKRSLAFLAAPPPPSVDVIDPAFPTRGTYQQRSLATRSFNASLAKNAHARNMPVIDLSSTTCSSNGPRHDEYFQDLIHYRVNVLPIACDELIRHSLVPPHRHAELRAAAAALSKVPWRPSAASIYVPPQIQQHLPLKHEHAAAIELALLDRAALECSWMGASRIAIYGAGRHTQRIGIDFLTRRGLCVQVILDDKPTLHELFGVPVRRTLDAPIDFDAVVISSDAHEDTMAQAAGRLFTPRCVRIVRIYAWREPWPGM